MPKTKYSNFFKSIQFDADECFLTFGSEGLIKIWNWKTGNLIYKQNNEESFKIENKRDKDSILHQVIVQAFYHNYLNTIVLTTVDKLIAFIKTDSEKVFQLEKQVRY